MKCLLFGLFMAAGLAHGQDARKVPISFLPPPLENATYSLGVYETKSGKLVRRLQEIAPEGAFTVGLNGLMTDWDGKDDEGKAVAPGRYAARGYAVGALKIEGVEIRGNDWAESDENLRIGRIEAIAFLPTTRGLGVIATMADGAARVACFDEKGALRWIGKPLATPPRKSSALPPSGYSLRTAGADGDLLMTDREVYRVSDGQPPSEFVYPIPSEPRYISDGKDGTRWQIEDGVLNQFTYPPQGKNALRQLVPNKEEPIPVAVSADRTSDRFYLLEETEGWQRVRGLSWVETKEENGKPVSTWQTFFERNIRMPKPRLVLSPGIPVEINLAENPLNPGKREKMNLSASFDDKGSYLTTTDGLRLRRISQRADLTSAKLSKGKTANALAFYQSDRAAWDEFSIEGAQNMMAFDAGEFEMTADGEKRHPAKAAEPPEL